jgi:hypothetical protein
MVFTNSFVRADAFLRLSLHFGDYALPVPSGVGAHRSASERGFADIDCVQLHGPAADHCETSTNQVFACLLYVHALELRINSTAVLQICCARTKAQLSGSDLNKCPSDQVAETSLDGFQ